MIDTPLLPKDSEALARVVRSHLQFEESRRYIRSLKWQLAQAYLQGVRRFEFGADGRSVFSFSVDKDAKLPMTVPELLLHTNKVSGLMQGMDIWPHVGRRGDSLSLVRDRGFVQATLDAVTNDHDLDLAKMNASHYAAYLGTVGISAHVEEFPSVGLVSDTEVIHPSELYPYPSIGLDHTKVRGTLRVRKVPLDFVKKMFPGKVRKDTITKMQTARRRFSATTSDVKNQELSNSQINSYGYGGGNIPSDPQKEEYVEVLLWELWVKGIGGTCARYAAGSGGVTLSDTDFTETGTVCYPGVSVIKFWETGDFYGAGLYDAIYTMVREFEHNVRSLVSNVRDIDRYQVLLLPHGSIDEKTAFRETGQGLKYMMYKPEASFLGQSLPNPMSIPVVNASEVPGRTAAYMQDLIRGSVPVRDILAEKGRVDSYAGLQYLEEESKRSGIVPISNWVRGWSETWRCLSYKTLQRMMQDPVKLPLKSLSLSLAGASVNFKEATISLSENRLPEVLRLSYSVREHSPKSKSIRKQEATANLEKGFLTIQQYILLSFEEGWEPALWTKGERGAYEVEIMRLLRLFNDGETPGTDWITLETTDPAIALAVCDAFMRSPEVAMASADVVDALQDHRNTLLNYQGKVLPSDIPDPYDAESFSPNPPMQGTPQ